MTSDLNVAMVYLLTVDNCAALREAPSNIAPSICGVQLHTPMQESQPGSSVEIGAPLSM